MNITHHIQYSKDEIYRNGQLWLANNATCENSKTIQASSIVWWAIRNGFKFCFIIA